MQRTSNFVGISRAVWVSTSDVRDVREG